MNARAITEGNQDAAGGQAEATGLGDRETRVHRLGDGRLLGYAEYGDPGGFPVLAFHGTPGSRFMFRLADPLAKERGVRLIAPDRPGYALSSPRRGRTFRDWPGDVAELAGALELVSFAVVGVSGGGPYAAALAAHGGSVVKAAAMVSPMGPVTGPQVAVRFSPEHRRIFLGMARSRWLSVSTFSAMRWAVLHAPRLALQGMMARAAEVDRAILARAEIGANLIDSIADGLGPGVGGAVRDLMLFGAPWGLELSQIAIPARVWQGDVDRNVPPAAAHELAAEIPGCEFVPLPETGHYWVFDHFGDVLDWTMQQVSRQRLHGGDR